MGDLGALGGNESIGSGINASRRVAGSAYNSGVDLGFFLPTAADN